MEINKWRRQNPANRAKLNTDLSFQTDRQTDSLYFSTMIIKAMQLMGSCIILNLRTKCVHNKVAKSNYVKLNYW